MKRVLPVIPLLLCGLWIFLRGTGIDLTAVPNMVFGIAIIVTAILLASKA